MRGIAPPEERTILKAAAFSVKESDMPTSCLPSIAADGNHAVAPWRRLPGVSHQGL